MSKMKHADGQFDTGSRVCVNFMHIMQSILKG